MSQLKGKRMNHQPFKDMLLSEEELSDEQSQLLQDHLSICESCSQFSIALTEVDSLLGKPAFVSPAPGFSLRWQQRLADYHQNRQRQSTWLVIALTSVLVVLISIVMGTQIWSFLQSPGLYMTVWLSRMLAIVSIYFELSNLAEGFHGYSLLYTSVAGFFLVGMVSFMSVFWLAAYQKFSMSRRMS
jgi:magnesium-transporting ATPase (P-type)